MQLEESELVKRCQRGDVQAFETLVERYADQAVRTAYLVTGCRELAEDMAQEAFIQCFYSIKQFKNQSSFRTWFYGVVVRVSRKMAARTSSRVPLEYLDGRAGTEELPSGADLSAAFEDKQAHEAVCRAIESLSQPLKAVVVLHYFNGFSVKEIAEALCCREGTVKSRLFNARKLLADRLQRAGGDFFDENQTTKESDPHVKVSAT